MKQVVLSCLFICLAGFALGQTTFTFECKCDYLSPADTNCDICNTNVLKRHFSGLLIRKNGVPFKWIDEPYTVRQLAGENVQFIEQIPTPDQITIARFQTQFSTMEGFIDSTICQCSAGGTTYIAGPGIEISGDTISAVDTSAINELQYIDTFLITGGVLYISLSQDSVPALSVTLPVPDGSETKVVAGTGISVSGSGTIASPYTITNTGDLSATNEGLLGVSAGGASSSVITSNTSGAVGVTVNVSGILSISESTSSNGGSITLTATEVDGSITNEIQTISASGAGPNSYNIDLSLSGGSVTLAEGAGIDLTRSGNTITAAVIGVPFGTGTDNYHPKWTTSGTVLSSTSLIYDNSTSIIIGGTTANGRLSIRETSGKNVYIGEGEVKLQGPAVAHWSMRANEGGVAGIYFINTSGGDNIGQSGTTRMYINDSEVSVTNNFKLGTYSGNAATTVVGRDASNVLTSVSLSGMSLISGTLTATDGSVSNEGVLGVGAGGGSSSTIVSTTSGANPVTINVSGILTISESTSANGGSITLTATEVDGSVTNEAQTLSASGTTSGIISLSTTGGAGGGSVTIAAGTGIGVAQSGGTITITNTASSNAWLIDGNTITTARRIGSNDNFDVVVETNGTDRFWFDNAGTVSLGATQLTTAAFNINGLQTGTGMLIAGGGSLVGPKFYTATGSGSGSTATVLSGVLSMISGNVEAILKNTATTGTGGGSVVTVNVTSGATSNDPFIKWEIDGVTTWTMGIDNDDVDNMKLHRFNRPSSNNGQGTIEIGYRTNDIGFAINKTGIGTTTNGFYALDVGGKSRSLQWVNEVVPLAGGTTGAFTPGNAAGTGPTVDNTVTKWWGNGGRLKFTAGTSPTANGTLFTVLLDANYTFGECSTIVQSRQNGTGFQYDTTYNSGTRTITCKIVGTMVAGTVYDFNVITTGN